jgi:hypothetical protein
MQPPFPTLQWTARLRLWRSRTVLGQLALALGIPLLLLFVLLVVLQWPPSTEQLLEALRVFGLIGLILFGLAALVVLLIYGGGYHYAYVATPAGITAQPTGRTRTINRVTNTLLLLSGRPGAMGAGLINTARQHEFVAWHAVTRLSLDPRDHAIGLVRGNRIVMLVACPPAQFAAFAAQFEVWRVGAQSAG